MHGFDFSIPFFSTWVRGTRIVITPQFVADVLHVPRIEHPNYPGCEYLRTVSKDEMISAFCERPADWSVVYCRRQPKIKPVLLKIYVVVRVRIVPTKSI